MFPSRIEALALLGLDEDFDHEQLKRARRRALMRHHPDHGGTAAEMAEIERACELLEAPVRLEATVPMERPGVRRGSDRPSFTIDVLPVEAFELLLLAAAELGDVADDDPPYRLEVRMHDPRDTWVVLEVVPDAGGSTVSLFVEGPTTFSVDDVRDAWVDAINRTCSVDSPRSGGLA